MFDHLKTVIHLQQRGVGHGRKVIRCLSWSWLRQRVRISFDLIQGNTVSIIEIWTMIAYRIFFGGCNGLFQEFFVFYTTMSGVSPCETHARSDLTPKCWDYLDPYSLACLTLGAGCRLGSQLGLVEHIRLSSSQRGVLRVARLFRWRLGAPWESAWKELVEAAWPFLIWASLPLQWIGQGRSSPRFKRSGHTLHFFMARYQRNLDSCFKTDTDYVALRPPKLAKRTTKGKWW